MAGKLGDARPADLRGFCIRPMRIDDVDAVVATHLEAFVGFFLSFLGPRFLAQLYRGILQDPSGIAFVCEDERAILGFVAGSAQPSGMYGRLLRGAWVQFALAAAPALARRPAVAMRLLRALRAPSEATSDPRTGTLMSIAVLPQAQGGGKGRQLVEAFLDEGRRRSLSAVNLTTDAIDNNATNRFYCSRGFRLVRTFTTPEGRVMNEYRIEISP